MRKREREREREREVRGARSTPECNRHTKRMQTHMQNTYAAKFKRAGARKERRANEDKEKSEDERARKCVTARVCDCESHTYYA